MKSNAILLAASLSAVAWPALSADYALSPDGAAVVRLAPQSAVAAASLGSSLLPSGWTQAAGSGGAISVTSYKAGFNGATGGAEIKALFTRGSVPPAGSFLEWVQVLNTNVPLGGNTSPYLDNAADTTKPFYSLTSVNTTPGLVADQLNFYDFSKRNPASLSTANPLTWNAKLYPVVADASNVLTVYDGVSWGWTMKKAMVGSTTGTFSNASPGSAVVSGLGSSSFAWGSGSPSTLSFAASAFDATPDTSFKLGTLTFRNGTIARGSGADAVTFNARLNFDNVPENDFTLSSIFSLVNTVNTSDPVASADQVSIGSWGYTFNVFEGVTASVDVMAKLSTGLVPSTNGTENGAARQGDFQFESTPSYTLSIVGLVNATTGGSVTPIPEPGTLMLYCFGLVGIGLRARQTRRGA